MEKGLHHRRSIRLSGYDYSQPGAYFITIVSYERRCVFGTVENDIVRLSPFGEVVDICWMRLVEFFPAHLDEYVIMPNHFHGIIWIDGSRERGSLGEAGGKFGEGQKFVDSPPASPLQNIQDQWHGTQSQSLGAIVQNFKAQTARRINGIRRTPGGDVWQRNYYEHVIRDENELCMKREYILKNPIEWALDEENPNGDKIPA